MIKSAYSNGKDGDISNIYKREDNSEIMSGQFNLPSANKQSEMTKKIDTNYSELVSDYAKRGFKPSEEFES